MKKLISVLLLLAMMLTVFVACSNGGEDPEETTADSGNTPTTPVEGETSDDGRLPDRDFEGYTFKWLHCEGENGIFVDEGEVVDETSIAYQAKVERDSEIFDRFNVKFADVSSGARPWIGSYITTDALNPEASYDVANVGSDEDFSGLIAGDLIMDAYEVPNLQLEREWYNQQAIKEFTIKDKLYFVAGAFTSFPGAPFFLFNKDLMQDLNLELPYDKILEGDWTVEELMKYTTAGYKDLGTPGLDKDDQFGYSGHPWSVVYFYQGFGGQTNTRNDKGEVVPIFSNDEVEAYYSRVMDFYKDSANYTSDTDPKNSHMTFFNGKALFCYWVTGTISFSDIDSFERGLAILPKYDEDQENYCCPAVGGLRMFPTNAADIDAAGYLYEALCEATLRIVYPATIQEAIDFEELTDQGSIDVRKLMDKSLVYDLLVNFDPTGGQLKACGFIMTCVQQNLSPAIMAQSVASSYEAVYDAFFQDMEKKENS